MLHDSYFRLAFFVRKARPSRYGGEVPLFVRITVSGQCTEMNIGRTIAANRLGPVVKAVLLLAQPLAGFGEYDDAVRSLLTLVDGLAVVRILH